MYDKPSLPDDFFVVLQSTNIQSDSLAREVHIFWPFIFHFPLTNSALVLTAARSEPAEGSEYP